MALRAFTTLINSHYKELEVIYSRTLDKLFAVSNILQGINAILSNYDKLEKWLQIRWNLLKVYTKWSQLR